MIYGEEKVRHLARNTKSQSSRSARSVKLLCTRKHRHAVGQHLHRIMQDTELWHDDTTATLDTHDGGYIRDSRGSYHSRPLRRWAVKTSGSISPKQRLIHLRSQLPPRISGHSATSWFSSDAAFRWEEHNQPSCYNSEAYRQKQAQRHRALARKARGILQIGLHSRFNNEVKRAQREAEDAASKKAEDSGRKYAPNPGAARVLLGVHDVEPFVDDLIRGTRLDEDGHWMPGRHPEWLEAFEQFCQRHNIN